MFEAIRSKLVGAWSQLRERDLIALFFFELVVVTLGVLLAQGIADWAEDRAAVQRMEDLRARNLGEIAQNAALTTLWKAALPCLDQRLEKIMDASPDRPLSPGDTRRPEFETVTPFEFDDRSQLLLGERYGSASAENFEIMRSNLLHARVNMSNLVEQWGALRLADPSRPTVDEADRQIAAENAAFLLNQLTGIRNALDSFSRRVADMRVEPVFAEPIRPIKNCVELWQHNAIAVPTK